MSADIFVQKKNLLGKLYACQTLVSKGFRSPYFLCFGFTTYSRFLGENKCETQKFNFLRNVRWDFSESVAVNPSVVGASSGGLLENVCWEKV